MKLLKTLTLVFFSVLSFSLFSCKSNKTVSVDSKVSDEESILAEDSDEEVNGSKSSSVDEDKNSGSVTEKSKNYTGWIELPVKNVDLKVGPIRFRTKSKLGSCNISYLTETGKYIPVISATNEYASSFYSLKTGKKTYKLSLDKSIKTNAKKNENGKGITMFYNIPNVAILEVKYDVFGSSGKTENDMIKVTATLTNSGEKRSSFELKSILDTVLGETTQTHFFTSDKQPVKSETLYRNLKDVKWIMSKNSTVKMQLLFDGADISPVDSVALANYVTLDSNSWEPDMLSYRSFDTVLSYNNSAVGIFWPKVSLESKESKSFVYYMAFAEDIYEPKGYEYVSGIKVEESEENVKEQNSEENDFEKNLEQVPLVIVQEPQADVQEIVTDVTFDVSKLTKEQLSETYIQKLIDKINALEEDDPSLNREELLQLNAELDAILEALR